MIGLSKSMGGTLYLLFGSVALLLAIGCGNVSILLLARGTGRQHELTVRSAVGAQRWRIVRQLLTEALLLASIGAALGAVALDTRGESVLSYTTGDFNGDGLTDIAAGGWDGLQILLGNGDGTFRRGINQFLGFGPGQILAADLRGNGNIDLILVNSLTSEEAQGACRGGGIGVLLGNGDGTYPLNATFYGVGQFTYDAVIADMNGDVGLTSWRRISWAHRTRFC